MGISLGDAILHLRTDSTKLESDLRASERDFANWWSGLGTMAAGAITGILASGVVVTRKALTQTVEYATGIRQMMSVTGQSAEATSRMIQVFKDFDISGGQVTMMLRTLATQGLSPTIETIARLSDQYLALAPGAERATFLQENFGRSGADLALVMDQTGAALLRRNAVVETGLVLGQAEIDKAEALRLAQDALSDATGTLTTSLAIGLAPSISAIVTQLRNAITPSHQLYAEWLDLDRAAAGSASTYRDYVEVAVEAAIANGRIAESARDYYVVGMLNHSLNQIETQTLGGLTIAQWEHTQAVNADTAARRQDRDAIMAVTGAINGIPTRHETDIILSLAVQTSDDYAQRLLEMYGPGLWFSNIGGVITLGMGGQTLLGGGARAVGAVGAPGTVSAARAYRELMGYRPMSEAELLAAGYAAGQRGLSFDVEGPSGADQVPVNLALTQGEHVQVTPAGEQRQGPQYPVTFNVYVNNRDDLAALENQITQIFRGV